MSSTPFPPRNALPAPPGLPSSPLRPSHPRSAPSSAPQGEEPPEYGVRRVRGHFCAAPIAPANSSDTETVVAAKEPQLEGAQEGDMKGGRKKKPVKAKRKAPEPWSKGMEKALRVGCSKIPNFGSHKVSFKGESIGRIRLLAEYVRRQTGEVRSKLQVRGKLANLKKGATGEAKKRLRGEMVAFASLAGRDWDTFLGLDLFPHTDPQSSASCAQRNKKAGPASTPCLPAPCTPPPKPSATAPSFTLEMGPPLNCTKVVMPSADPLFPPPSTPTPRPSLPSSLPTPPSATEPSTPSFLCSTSTALSADDIEAFLASISPSAVFSTSATALFGGGITTLDALRRLVLLDDGCRDTFLATLVEERDMPVHEAVEVGEALAQAQKELMRGAETT
ncbi:hypothetical protein JCM10213_002467 [Rhodosporidiobolus nylandii]